METKWCRVCARILSGGRRICERCRSRERRGKRPAEAEARLLCCAGCHRTFAVPFDVPAGKSCSAACESRRLEWAARNAEVREARQAWEARERSRQSPPTETPGGADVSSAPVFEQRLVREIDPSAPWTARKVWRLVEVK